MKQVRRGSLLPLLAPLAYLAAAVLVVLAVCWNGIYPSGSDTMYHVYRGDFVYRSLLEGNWWPAYDPMWYNGVELLRYWAPLPAYFMALCQALAGGDPLNGYLIFVGLICFLGALPWLYMGFRMGRPWLGAVLGLLWFFMPNNLLALFQEGNLARSLSMVFLPLFFYACSSYLERPRRTCLLGATVSFALVTLCHLGYGGMVALGTLLYLLLWRIFSRRKGVVLPLIGAIGAGFLILGVWLYPSLGGGMTSVDNSEVMAGFFQPLLLTLNPLDRYASHNGNFYFGLAAFLAALLGAFLGRREAVPSFWAALLICGSTAAAMYPVLNILPGSQYLWMLRFISIALCMILWGLLRWDTLRRPLCCLLVLLLCLDVIPSLDLIRGNQTGDLVEDRLDAAQESTLITAAQELTEQRLALMDLSSLSATGAWLVSAWGNPVPATFGAGWTAASTSSNIVQLNRALEGGQYHYLFDRCMELGNDTVLIRLASMLQEEDGILRLDRAAEDVGYRLAEENAGYRLYHLDVPGTWGTVTKYPALGLGPGAAATALGFPAMEEAESINLSDYSFEELSLYSLILLSQFTYDDRAYAEDLILRLSEAGVRVVIAADGIPEDRKTHDQSFLGVTCNAISFSNGYPELDTIDGLLNTDLFPPEHADWDCVYLEGLDDCWGTVLDNGLELDFYGTGQNENLIFIGLNLTYFFSLTRDPTVEALLSHAMDLPPDQLPQREIVPLEVDVSGQALTVTSPRAGVNTALAYHKDFAASQPISSRQHLTIVGEGVTSITLRCPNLKEGTAVSIAGALLLLLLLLFHKKEDDQWKPHAQDSWNGQTGPTTTPNPEAGSPPSPIASLSGNWRAVSGATSDGPPR